MSRKGSVFRFDTPENCAEGHVVNCVFYKRDDGATLFHFTEDKAYLDMVGYVIYPIEELPPDAGAWPWRKVGRLIARRALVWPKGCIVRARRKLLNRS